MKAVHLIYICACATLVAGVAELNIYRQEHWPESASGPDEKTAGLALLIQKQSAAGYFHSDANATAKPGIISIGDAQAQVARVLHDRHRPDQEASALKTLIDQVSEPAINRSIEGRQINVMKLNLALDAQH